MRPSTVPALRLVAAPEASVAKEQLPVPSFDDHELLAALRAGDDSASTALYDRLRPCVDVTIRRVLGRRDVDHEDLVQLSIIEIVASIHAYRGECALDGWASRVTAHVVYKHLRRRKLEQRTFAGEPDDDSAAAESTSRLIAVRDLVSRVRRHLDAMEEAKAWTFLLHDVCGFDLREIAEITGVSVAAAQSRLVRGRREIHERVAADPALHDSLSELEVE